MDLKGKINDFFKKFRDDLVSAVIWAAFSIICGIVTGLCGTGFAKLIVIATDFRLSHEYILFFLPFAGLFIAWVYKLAGSSIEGGTNLVLKDIREGEEVPMRMAPVIFIATVTTHLFGGSVGREGAALQMGGSMGSVVGEKVTRIIEKAIELRLPVLAISSSGGARMQESALSLMQMAKTSCACARLDDAGLLYINLITDPTFGGVTASFGTLGDVIVAEQGARVGFAGRRVIEQTIRQKLPSDFQTAEYLLKYGQVDVVSSRKNLRSTLSNILSMYE